MTSSLSKHRVNVVGGPILVSCFDCSDSTDHLHLYNFARVDPCCSIGKCILCSTKSASYFENFLSIMSEVKDDEYERDDC
ncbi:unnamed protein product [Lactuca virosa]|uniref:Uncharacterized protein n=1 Tax=Lactuca virosa TaxID=75947 RepID=A0AAU9LSX1_9ASTR|nr:unnamed protein product [Lactuca virosa]